LKVRFLSTAGMELDEAIRYYDHQLSGLGFRFFQEVNAAIGRVKLMPEAWTRIDEQNEALPSEGFPLSPSLCRRRKMKY